jgi:meso-butanediol dehydrogenase/(S,S)-butanediol dehydrogenase/diacetyl reductase
MADRTYEALSNFHGKTRKDVVNDFQKNIPLGRIGQPDDVANLVSFLASKDSDYITGQSILVNGGRDFS